jgi:hypothetical protein
LKPEEAIASLNSLFPDSKYKFIRKTEKWHDNGIHEVEFSIEIWMITGLRVVKASTLKELLRKIKETK